MEDSPNYHLSKDKLLKQKRQLLILTFLIVALPLALYFVLTQTIYKRTKAAGGNAVLSLVPVGLNKNGANEWEFTQNTPFQVQVKVDSGTTAIESAEAMINYDQTILSATSVQYPASGSLLNQDAFKCRLLEVPPFDPIMKDGSGNQIGKIHLARTAIPLPDCNPAVVPTGGPKPPYVPLGSNGNEVIATITFNALQRVTTPSTKILGFEYFSVDNPGTPEDDTLNDSNVAEYNAAGIDTLGSVVNNPYVVIRCIKMTKGDANCDSSVDIGDFGAWRIEARAELGGNPSAKTGDFNNDNGVNIGDFGVWRIGARAQIATPTP